MASSHRKPRSAGSRITGIWAPADDGDRSIGEVERKVDDLYRQAESGTETYNATRERAARQRGRVDTGPEDVPKLARKLNSARERLGSFTAAQYRTGAAAPDASAFLLPDTPQDYFEQAQLMSRLTSRQKNAVRHETTENLRTPDDTQSDLRTAKATVQKKLSTARELLSRPTARTQRTEATRSTSSGSSPVDSFYATKAAKAVAFARAQVGKPYVWGAAGPGSYDCSGLTQAAWKAAEVTLPRVITDQANAGTTVSLADAQPGDLVFFYDDVSHVGLYVGDGTMIHAPKPGAYVREESIHHDDAATVHSVVRPA
ncbi:NlpC/P60 family protein [Streptomyces sp. NBC_01515]|uniref:C40 family peptidase n=1 Tax=Streptomyces sp. NBC_01515 TaxID=2903890 RepID=UPI0038636341